MKKDASKHHHHWQTLAAACSATFMASVVLAQSPNTQPDVMSPPATQPANNAPYSQGVKSGTDDLTHLSLEDLMNVEVTSVSKKKQSIADAPAAVTVISQDDISRSGFSTIPDLLRLAPGMDVARINSYTWAVSARGLNDQFASKLEVLQDGRSLYTPITSGVYWDSVDYVLEDLDRIEVIRGPGATLWGANAVNGVVNIISKDAEDTQGWLLSSRGSNDNSSLTGRYGGKLADDTYYRVYTKASYDDALDTASGGNAGDSWYSMHSGFRIDKHPSDNDTFTLQGDIGDNQMRVPAQLPIPAPPFVENKTFNGADTAGNVIGRWTHRVNDDSDFALQVYYDYLGINEGPEASEQHTVDFDFHDRFMLGKRNDITWGLGYRVYRTNGMPTDIAYFTPSVRTDSLYSAFAQDTLAIEPDRWFLTFGTKFEQNDYTGLEIQPSAKLLWTPNKQNSVWASVSRSVRTPARSNTDLHVVAADFAVPNSTGGTAPAELLLAGNPNFDSEKMIAYELGYRVQATKEVSIDVATFYNTYTQLRSREAGPVQPGPVVVLPSEFGNNIRGDTYGAEIATDIQVTSNWRLKGSYSLLETTFETSPGSNDTMSAKADEGSAPQNQAQFHSYWDITRNLQLNGGIYYTGRVAEYNVPSFISTDLNLVWTPREGLELSVGVLNLFDNHHPEFNTVASEGIADELPRTLYVQASYKF